MFMVWNKDLEGRTGGATGTDYSKTPWLFMGPILTAMVCIKDLDCGTGGATGTDYSKTS